MTALSLHTFRAWWFVSLLNSLFKAQALTSPSAYLTLHCDNHGALYISNDGGTSWELSGTADHWPTPFVAEILDIVPETVIRWECMLKPAVFLFVPDTLCLFHLQTPWHLLSHSARHSICKLLHWTTLYVKAPMKAVSGDSSPRSNVCSFCIWSIRLNIHWFARCHWQITVSCTVLPIRWKKAIGHWSRRMTG